MNTFWISLRFLHFIAVMLLTGSAFYTALLAPVRYRAAFSQRIRHVLYGCAGLALCTALLMLAVQNVLMSGDWRNLYVREVWLAVINTRFGSVWLWEIIFSSAGVLSLMLAGPLRQQGLLLSGVLQLVCQAMTGHAAMYEGGVALVQQSNHALHLIAASFWGGGLLPLLILMSEARKTEHRADAIRTMLRFSRYGHLAVIVVILTGLINSLLISDWPLRWHHNVYTLLLISKVLLVVLMVMVAIINRYWLVPRFHQAGSSALHRFIRLTQCEILLVLVVIGLVSLFATLSPV